MFEKFPFSHYKESFVVSELVEKPLAVRSINKVNKPRRLFSIWLSIFCKIACRPQIEKALVRALHIWRTPCALENWELRWFLCRVPDIQRGDWHLYVAPPEIYKSALSSCADIDCLFPLSLSNSVSTFKGIGTIFF